MAKKKKTVLVKLTPAQAKTLAAVALQAVGDADTLATVGRLERAERAIRDALAAAGQRLPGT